MRTILTRLALAGVFGIALSGCGGSNGNALPTGSVPNGSSGGPVQGTNGVGAPPAGTVPSQSVDGGAAPGFAGGTAYTAVGTTIATDTVTAGNPAASPPPTGSHSIVYTANSQTSEVVKYGGTAPSLVYQFGIPPNTAFFNYGEIDVVGATYTPAVGTTVPSSIAVELTGGSATSAFDVRLVCGGPPLGATATTYRCLGPTNGVTSGNSYGAPSGTYTTKFTAGSAGPPVIAPVYTRPTAATAPTALLFPTDTGNFTPTAPTVYVVLTFSGPFTGGTLVFVGLTAAE